MSFEIARKKSVKRPVRNLDLYVYVQNIENVKSAPAPIRRCIVSTIRSNAKEHLKRCSFSMYSASIIPLFMYILYKNVVFKASEMTLFSMTLGQTLKVWNKLYPNSCSNARIYGTSGITRTTQYPAHTNQSIRKRCLILLNVRFQRHLRRRMSHQILNSTNIHARVNRHRRKSCTEINRRRIIKIDFCSYLLPQSPERNACSGVAQSCLDLLESARGRYDGARNCFIYVISQPYENKHGSLSVKMSHLGF